MVIRGNNPPAKGQEELYSEQSRDMYRRGLIREEGTVGTGEGWGRDCQFQLCGLQRGREQIIRCRVAQGVE